jgi:prepilin-type N-terminal cleavage/methylation domain-containing protein
MKFTKQGFTILEVMMATGIVLILAAVLILVQYKARDLRERTRCINSLHQWSLALTMHASEHEGRYPSSTSLYTKSADVSEFLSRYLQVSDAGTYSQTSLPIAMCRSGAATAANNTAFIGWALLAGYDNLSSFENTYAGVDMRTERSAQDSGLPYIACLTATDGTHWVCHGSDFVLNPTARPTGQAAAWPDGRVRWVKFQWMEPAVIGPGASTYFMPGKHLE